MTRIPVRTLDYHHCIYCGSNRTRETAEITQRDRVAYRLRKCLNKGCGLTYGTLHAAYENNPTLLRRVVDYHDDVDNGASTETIDLAA